MDAPVLFCSSTIWERHEATLLAAAPGVQPVLLAAGQRIADDDVGRITVAFASHDMYPGTLPAFMRICLDAPKLEWLQTLNAGIDHPVFGMIRDRGVRLTTASGSTAVPIAHHVMLCVLAMAHDLPGFFRDQQRHEWNPRALDDVDQRVIGVIGMGPIGTEVARLGTQFGMRAIGVRRSAHGDEPCETWTFDRLDELLALADDLVLALPLAANTRGIIGDRELQLMRPGTRIVNVGRGELIDEPALVDHLRSGHIGAAALDVFATEPLPPDSPLWDLPNVIVTPHTSGDTQLAKRRVEEIFIDNLGRWMRGEPLRNEVSG
jgi:D-2-hydroxyacid dehydrogenase (NADP+)